ncbi:YciI family protein [Falsiroseomonas sp. E2-1-a20]|uniref:YciI family protein n=1 Tax=Falsiroseomonas sp. E2-1-a20 TaxID=3239300 RepID=UPI003F3E1D63
MAHAILAWDGDDEGAPARRAAARDRHVAHITAEAAAGRLLLGLPLHDEAGRGLGSLMVVAGDAAARDAYLAGEPFANSDVWRKVESHPFRIAPLPYQPWPAPDSPPPTGRTHSIIIAWDDTDAEALERRLAARPAHFERVQPMAARGTLLFGGAILDSQEGRMIGSIAVTRHVTHEAARNWLEGDPYVTGDVWRDISIHATTLRPLPYARLPG